MKKISLLSVFLPITRHSVYLYPKIIILILFILFGGLIPSSLIEYELIRIFIIGFPSYLFINILFSYIRSVFIKLYLRKHDYDIGHVDNYVIGIRRISLFLGNTLFIFVLMALLGISVSSLITSVGLFAVAITLIFKDYINNFINGILIMFSKSIKLNEYVKIGDIKGRITDITFANTEIQTDSGELYYFPNNIVYTKEIANLSRNKSRTIKIEASLTNLTSKKYEEIKKNIVTNLKKIGIENSDITLNKLSKDTTDIIISFSTKKYSWELEKKAKETVFQQCLKHNETVKETKK